MAVTVTVCATVSSGQPLIFPIFSHNLGLQVKKTTRPVSYISVVINCQCLHFGHWMWGFTKVLVYKTFNTMYRKYSDTLSNCKTE